MNLDGILQESKTDALLAGHLEEVQEYSQIYLLAKERQKGCNSMAQFVMLKEEFKDAINKLIQYCRRKNNHMFAFEEHDLDSLSQIFENGQSGVMSGCPKGPNQRDRGLLKTAPFTPQWAAFRAGCSWLVRSVAVLPAQAERAHNLQEGYCNPIQEKADCVSSQIEQGTVARGQEVLRYLDGQAVAEQEEDFPRAEAAFRP